VPILHLGVIQLPYVQAPSANQKKVKASTVTTGDVAGWLEDNYSIMQTFMAQHGAEVADAFAESMKGAIENLVMGAPVANSPFGEAESETEHLFKRFITTGEMDRLGIPGVPTQAAKDRASGKKRSSRMKKRRGRGQNAQPVSFYDTGLYESSFKAWVE
jgi:hypothetical protein